MVKNELLELLKRQDEITLLELLEITAEDIVDAFTDRIEDNEARIRRNLQD